MKTKRMPIIKEEIEEKQIIVEWKDSFSIGIKKIDDQHKALIHLINELYDGSFKREKTKELFNKTLKKAYKYTDFHFKSEEKIFDKIKYNFSDEHKLQHKVFMAEILDRVCYIDAANQTLCRDFVKFLVGWVAEHIAIHDKKFGLECDRLVKEGKLIFIE